MNRLLGRSEEGCHFNCKLCGDVDLHSRRETNSPSLNFKTKKYLFNQTVLEMGGRVISCDDKDILLPIYVCGIISSLVKDDHLSFVN